MKLLSKCIAGFLVLSVVGLYFPKVSFCTDPGLYAKAEQKTITRHKPKFMSEPEKDIPVVASKADEQKGPNWLLLGGAAVLVIGLAAAAGGGGGGGGGSSSNDASPAATDTGNISVQW